MKLRESLLLMKLPDISLNVAVLTEKQKKKRKERKINSFNRNPHFIVEKYMVITSMQMIYADPVQVCD